MMRTIYIPFLAILTIISTITAPATNAQGGAPEPDGFHFYWPGSCVQAIERSSAFYWRARQDSARYDPATDTILSSSSLIAKTCAKEFENASLKPRDYVPLAEVYLAANDDNAASATIKHRLSLPDVETAGPRAWVLADIVDAYLTASPPRLDEAIQFIKALDKLEGAEAAIGKVRAYHSLATHYWRTGYTTGLVAAAEGLILAGKSLDLHDRNDYSRLLFAGYRFIADVRAAATADSLAPLDVMRRAKEEIGSLINVETYIQRYSSLARLYNSKAELIVGDRWLIREESDTISPATGKFNLIVFGPSRRNIPHIRRLANEFRNTLNVIGILGTSGHFQGTGPLSHEAEEAALRQYYLEQLDVPFPLVLSFVHYTRLPDGRRMADATLNEQNYQARSGGTIILVDPSGAIVRVWTAWDKSYENRISEAIHDLKDRAR